MKHSNEIQGYEEHDINSLYLDLVFETKNLIELKIVGISNAQIAPGSH